MSTETITELRARWAGMIPVATADGLPSMARQYTLGVEAIDQADGDPARAALILRRLIPDTVLADDLDELAERREYRYLVTYTINGGAGYGNAEINRSAPIDGDWTDIPDLLAKGKDVTLLNVIPLPIVAPAVTAGV
ncbi:hypothetical protein GCM10010124_26410 [Pilimelia terevasa]|uniref:Uncharacterized protein n=1 Tax=Pilimelia terevasa TaxID=53372 RepID=A0A8J3FKA2_9ACTN|nr:hypothetical protein [Pilimelia terevasa]GGK32335.1 hypothetical protein GCM10010124_26410 [Pilimelia terevasa]